MKIETIAEQLLFSTLLIETQTGLGTGAIVNYEWKEQTFPFLVTNKHVISDTLQGKITFTQADTSDTPNQPLLGKPYSISIGEEAWRWTPHPSENIDVAILPLGPAINHINEQGIDVFFRGIPTEIFPSPGRDFGLDAVEEILFIGYPSGVIDPVNNLPVFRKGITATPIAVDFGAQPIFLIDASVFHGSSGSPVFIYNKGTWATKGGVVEGGERIIFLGILGSGYYRTDKNTLEFQEVPTTLQPFVSTPQMIDLGVVYKAKAVLDLIEQFLRRAGQLPPQSSGAEAAS